MFPSATSSSTAVKMNQQIGLVENPMISSFNFQTSLLPLSSSPYSVVGGGGGDLVPTHGDDDGHHFIRPSNNIDLWSPDRASKEVGAVQVNHGGMISSKNNGKPDSGLGVGSMSMRTMMKKKVKGARRKMREPRFCFKTMSEVDVLDDGYKWRKYGQKVVKNTQHPRSYYRCTQENCRVKKRIERLAEDPRMVITTYEGRHVHSPSHDEEDSQAPSKVSTLFW